jgi:hypothetical protein
MGIGPTTSNLLFVLYVKFHVTNALSFCLKQLKFEEKLQVAVSCSHIKANPMSGSECNNVANSLIQSYDIACNLLVLIINSL